MKNIVIVVATLLGGVATYGQTTLSLSQCKEMALKNNVAMKNSQLEIDAAKEVKKNAYTNYFPKVSANAMAMKAADPMVSIPVGQYLSPVLSSVAPILAQGGVDPASLAAGVPNEINALEQVQIGSINIIQPLYVGGQIRTGNQLAQLGVDVKEQQQLLTRNEVLLKTEQQYWLLVSLQEKQKTIEKYEELLTSIEKQVNDAQKSGLILKNDQLKVKLKISELKANKNQLKNGKKLATMQFCQTIGTPYDSNLVLNDSITEIPEPSSIFVLSNQALSNRTEFQLLEKSIEAEDLQAKLARGEFMPQVAVGATGYYVDGYYKDADPLKNAMVYATLSIPISDWWGGAHKIKEHKYKQQIAQNNFDDTKKLLTLQMEKGWTDLTQTYEYVELMQQTNEQAQENLKISQDSYNSGIITVSDLLESQALIVEIEDKLIEAKSNYMLAIASYLQMTAR